MVQHITIFSIVKATLTINITKFCHPKPRLFYVSQLYAIEIVNFRDIH